MSNGMRGLIHRLGTPACWLTPCLLVPCLFVVGGCAAETNDEPEVVKNLFAVSQAYSLVFATTHKPPTSMEQISTTLAELHAAEVGPPPEQVLVSPRDGLPFVVVLGTPLDPDAKNTVYIYEQKGVDGKRYVLMVSQDIAELSEEAFSNATFPRGHKPAKT